MEPWKLKLGLLVLILVALIALVFWWRSRKERQDALDHAAELAKFAAGLGGTLTVASAWSADLRRPFAEEYGDVIGWLHRASESRFDHAVDFERYGWQVRVTEASIELNSASTQDKVVTHVEHRIEVATAGLVPLKLAINSLGGGRGAPRWVAEAPQSLASSSQPQWHELRLPAGLDQLYLAATADPHRAAAMITPAVVQRLQGESQAGNLRTLTVEAGIAYTVETGPIVPTSVMQTVDAIIGVLDRIPGAQPRSSAPTA
ncbi:hypothetical protein [Lentzea cavernae]|uniref:Uncharacterized protein n=1 Tax=Lentzea cavernae TaxID=2020703 RepID=A0ABQ3MW99_9PSEU|nr:hypothetical protein [Lentzea cavernae]GHH60179.1 hypothetical protein GCM10017774_84210 [Lentzea cavernae]